MLEHPEPGGFADTLNQSSVRALGRIGPDARTAAPALMRLLEKGDVNQFEAVKALDGIGAPPVSNLLGNLLGTGNPDAADALAWLGPRARDASRALRRALVEERPQVRYAAATALAYIEPSASDSVPVLNEALSHFGDQDLELSRVPAALGHLGPLAKPALPKLVELLTDGSANPNVLCALVQIDPEGKQSVPALISALGSEDSDVVYSAAIYVGLLGSRAKAAVPALARVFTREFEYDDGTSDYGPRAERPRPCAGLVSLPESQYPSSRTLSTFPHAANAGPTTTILAAITRFRSPRPIPSAHFTGQRSRRCRRCWNSSNLRKMVQQPLTPANRRFALSVRSDRRLVPRFPCFGDY